MIIEAIHKGGVFTPTQPVDVTEGARVRLDVHPSDAQDAAAEMLARYPNSFGLMPPENAAEIMRKVDEEFGMVKPRDWS